MFRCQVCASTEACEAFTSETFCIDGQWLLVEHIPVMRCARCGDESFSREVTEQVRRVVREQPEPKKTVSMIVLTLP